MRQTQESLFNRPTETARRAGDAREPAHDNDDDNNADLDGEAILATVPFLEIGDNDAWLIHSLMRSRANEHDLVRLDLDQLSRECGLTRAAVCAAIKSELGWDGIGLAVPSDDDIDTYSVSQGSEDGGPKVAFPNRILRDPTIPVGVKRGLMAALLCGWNLRGSAADGAVLIAIPSTADAIRGILEAITWYDGQGERWCASLRG